MPDRGAGGVGIFMLGAVLFAAAGPLAADGVGPPEPPLPYDGAANVEPQGLVLSWSAVPGAQSYDVYLGTTPDGLIARGSVAEPRYAPTPPLAAGRRYYWRVDVQATGTTSTPGPIWRFTTSPPESRDAGLLVWLAFDEAFGDTSRDLSGNGCDAEAECMTWNAAGTPGVDGASIQSDGSGWARFQIPARRPSPDALTLAGWFLIHPQREPAAMWSLGSGQGSCVDFVVQPVDRGGPIVEVVAEGNRPVRSEIDDSLPLSHWTHLAFVMDGPGGQITVYEDGAVVRVVRDLTGLADILGQAREVFLGTSFSRGSYLFGGVDDVRLYGGAFDAVDVARSTFGPPGCPCDPVPRQWAQVHAGDPGVLRWQGTPSATAYNVYTGISPDHLNLTAGGLTGTECTLTQPPSAGQTCYWRVEAVQDNGFVSGPLWQYSVTGSSLGDVNEDAPPWWTDFGKYYRQIVPDVALTDIDGGGHRLRDYRGRQLIVVVWAPWCSVCRQEMTPLLNLQKTMGEDRLAVLAITDEANRASLGSFLAGRPDITFPVCVAKLSLLPAPFRSVSHLPTCFYIAPDGLIKLGTVGPVPEETMQEILAAAWPGP